MRSFLICVLFHLLFSNGILPRSGKLYTPQDLDWRDPKLNDFEELVGEPFFDPFIEKESSSSEDSEEPVGDLEITFPWRASHINDEEDPLEYAVGDFLPSAEDDSNEPPPELDDEDMDRLYDDPDEVELALAVEDSQEEPVGSDFELDELAKLFLDDSDEDSVDHWDDSDEIAVGESDDYSSEDSDFSDSLEDSDWDDSLEDSDDSLDEITVGESDDYSSEDSDFSDSLEDSDWDDSLEDSDDSLDEIAVGESDDYSSEDSDETWDDSEDSVGSEDSDEWDDSVEDSDDWEDSSEEDSVGEEYSYSDDKAEYLEDVLQDDSDDFEEDEVAEYSEDDDGLEGFDSEEEVGDFIETAVGDFVDDSSDYVDEDSEKQAGEADLLSEEYDSSDLLPGAIEESSSDESFDSEAEELVGSGMPHGLFQKTESKDDDGLESQEFAVGESPDYLHESEDSDDNSEDYLDSLESDDSDFLEGDLDDDSLFDEAEVGDLESFDDDDDDDDDEMEVGDPYAYMDDLFGEDPVGDIGELPPFIEEEPVGELDADGWAILDAPPYATAKNLESRHRQRHDADGWDRNERNQEPVSEDEEGLSKEERSYRGHRKSPHARRGRLQREYRPRHHQRERVTTFLDDAEESVGNAETMLDEIDDLTSDLDFLTEEDVEDLRRRLQDDGPAIDSDDFSESMSLEDHLHAIHNLHQVHKKLMQLKQQHEMEEAKKKLQVSEDSKENSKGPMLIVHTHHVPKEAQKPKQNTQIHQELHDFVMNHKDEDDEKKKKAQMDAEKAELMKRMEEQKKNDASELNTLRKKLSDYKNERQGENEKLKAKLLALKDIEKAKAEERRKKEEAKKENEADEKKREAEEKRKVEDAEKEEKKKALERKKAEARKKIEDMKKSIRDKKKQKLQEARDLLVKKLRQQLKELKSKSKYRKQLRDKRQKEKAKKKEEEERKKEEEAEKKKKEEERKQKEEEEEKEQNKLTDEKKKALIKKMKAERERRKKKAMLANKSQSSDSDTKDQFPFVRHFFGHTGDLEEECGETKCRCGFYKVDWKYKNHCYMVEGDCQECDAPDSKKVKAIGFTYKYIEQVKKRLPIFTYRRRGKQWHNEPKEKSVCPKGKIVTGIRTMVTKEHDKHKHSMKIKCGPGNGKPLTKEDEEKKQVDARKKEEVAKQKYDKDEEDAQKNRPPDDGKKDPNTDDGPDDPTKCLSKGKGCTCGFSSVTFNQEANGCFIPGGECNECGNSGINGAVQAVGFNYVYNDQAKKEFPKFVVRNKGSQWTEPKKQFQCKNGYVVNGVWTSAEKDVLSPAENGQKKKRDRYYLSITCRKAEYSKEEKETPSTTMSATDEEKQDKKDEEGDDNSSPEADGPVKQHECPPAVSECKCGFSFVAWRKTNDCYQLEGECLECGTPGAVNAIGYNYKFDKERKKSVYRWRYRTEGKLWSQPERRYSCRQGKIVTNIATSAVRSGDEVKYHLWMKCNDAIPTTPKVALNGMVSWFKYSGWDGTAWRSTLGNHTMSVVGGQIATKIERGDGAENGVWQVQGNTQTQVSFGEILPRDYTICTLSRYTGPKNQKRILIGTSGNWLHGHWSGQAGVAIYGTWVTRSVNRVEPATNWLYMCGQNAQRSIIRANGMSIKKANGGIKGPMKLQINKGGCCEKESSDWAVAEVMTWDRFLTFTELIHVEAYMRRILKKGNLDQKPQTTQEVAVFMSQPALTPIPQANGQVAVAEISTTQRALSLKNAPELKPKLDVPNLGLSDVKPVHVKLDMDKNIQQAVSEAFDNIDNSIDDDSEVALADSEPTRRYHSPAQRTEENLLRTQLGLAKVGGLVNFNVVLLALLVFGVVAIVASCVYFSKEQGDAVDAYYDSLANELQKFNF